MNPFYYILTHVCYYIGHPLSLLTNFVAEVSPGDEGLIDNIYWLSSLFLGWSSDLDKNEWLWLSRRCDETEEEFTQRCHERWPELKE